MRLSQLPSLESLIIRILKDNPGPMAEREIQRRLFHQIGVRVSKRSIRTTVKNLRDAGYDIQEHVDSGVRKLSMLRSGFSYNIQGKVSTPFLITSDWHIGSTYFSEMAWRELVRDVRRERIRDILAAGDLLQGLGVYRIELMDLKEPKIEYQIEEMIEHLKMLPRRCRVHMVIGGHEEKIKGRYQVGLDPLKTVANSVRNVRYYGSVANLKVNGRWRLMMMHSAGVSVSIGSTLLNIFRRLPEPKPDILVTGHRHQLLALTPERNKLLIEAGCLQKESSYLLGKGYVAQVGWLILDRFGRTTQVRYRRPKEV